MIDNTTIRIAGGERGRKEKSAKFILPAAKRPTEKRPAQAAHYSQRFYAAVYRMPLLAFSFVLLLALAYHFAYLSRAILIAYGVMSLLTFMLYGVDKQAAIQGRRRIPERHLHLCALFGGWPGALLAQELFRHKRRKRPFQIGLWGAAALNTALVIWLMRG